MTKNYPVAINDETHGEALEAIKHMRDNHISFSAVVRDLLIQYKNNGYQFGHSCKCKKG